MRKTCYGCDSLYIYRDALIPALASCGKNGMVVPQSMDAEAQTLRFWRIPVECPLASGVLKQEEQVAEKDQVLKSFEELK